MFLLLILGIILCAVGAVGAVACYCMHDLGLDSSDTPWKNPYVLALVVGICLIVFAAIQI